MILTILVYIVCRQRVPQLQLIMGFWNWLFKHHRWWKSDSAKDGYVEDLM